MTIGSNNQHAIDKVKGTLVGAGSGRIAVFLPTAADKVKSTLAGGGSGRLSVLLLTAAMFGLGIYTGNLWLSVSFGIATAAAAWVMIGAVRSDLAARRMQRRA